MEGKQMQKIKATSEDGSFCCVTWKQQNNSLFSISTNHYNSDGYYRADLSTSRENIPYEIILNGIEAAKRLFKKVEIY